MPGGVRFPLRMVVVRLPGGGLLLHSPIAIDDALAAALAQLGEVTAIVAPNCLHHLYLAAAKERYADAPMFGAPGLADKRGDLKFDAVLEPPAPADWGGAIELLPIAGAPKVGEVALLHRPSRSLLVTDLVFHLRAPENLRTALLLRIMGAHGRLASSRAWRWMLVRDRAAFRESLRELLRSDFDRLIPSHGEVVDADARAALGSALGSWLQE
ncbi:MAG: DUF4336 domain-containing protein [Myxococcales bacterium]|nr:DUF4336 domain-containing protein [Myxococcales bacterium]